MTAFCSNRLIMVVAVAGLVLALVSTANAVDPKYERLARDVVRTSANVQAGDVVAVHGGKPTIDLMEAVASEVLKLGGMPTMFLTTDQVARARYLEMPDQFLDQDQTYFAEWLKQIDVWISVPAYEDPKAVWAGIPEERLAKSRKSLQVVWDMLDDARIRLLNIGYPTKEQAEMYGLDFDTYQGMHWKAATTDYRKISEKGNYLVNILKGAKNVHVTTPHGTDVTFTVGNRPIFLDDGIVTKEEARSNRFLDRIAALPGGAVMFAPIESSANGNVVVPRHRCRYKPLTGISFEFKDGKLKNFKADKGGECFTETMAPYTGAKDTIGYINIGLNPEWKVMEDPGDFRPEDAAGMIVIGIGNNELYGGNNKDTTAEFSFPIVNATVDVDGRTVIKDGKLMF
jgi:aminopeptidase